MSHPATKGYSSDVEGGARVQIRYVLTGRIEPRSYLAFVADRAHWLGLDGWADAHGDGAIELVAAGPEALVGALEMACTLGPLDALVDRIEASIEGTMVPPGFTLR